MNYSIFLTIYPWAPFFSVFILTLKRYMGKFFKNAIDLKTSRSIFFIYIYLKHLLFYFMKNVFMVIFHSYTDLYFVIARGKFCLIFFFPFSLLLRFTFQTSFHEIKRTWRGLCIPVIPKAQLLVFRFHILPHENNNFSWLQSNCLSQEGRTIKYTG